MALKPELDTLEGLSESDAGHYTKDEDGKYKLDIDGQVPAPELKKALAQERENAKKARQEAEKLRQQQAEIEQKSLEDKEEYKTLWEKQKEENERILADRRKDQKDFFIEKTVSSLTKDEKKARALRRNLQVDVGFGPDGELVVKDIPEVQSPAQLEGYYKENMPFLVDGSKASGGGSTGGRSGGGSVGEKTLTQQEFDALNASEKMKFMTGGGRVTKE